MKHQGETKTILDQVKEQKALQLELIVVVQRQEIQRLKEHLASVQVSQVNGANDIVHLYPTLFQQP